MVIDIVKKFLYPVYFLKQKKRKFGTVQKRRSHFLIQARRSSYINSNEMYWIMKDEVTIKITQS